MKRWIVWLLVLASLSALLNVSASADVIWEPDDHFYWKHSDECDYYCRTRIVNSPEGGLALRKAPESNRVVYTAKNGEAFYIYFTYDDGKWGLVEFDDGSTAWLELTQTVLKYDNTSFMEEFSDRFYEDTQATEQMLASLSREDLIYDYSYPGSGSTKSYIPAKYVLEFEGFSLQPLFQDEANNIWGYVGYFMGHRGWVCLSDPTNSELPEFERQQLELYPAKELGSPQSSNITALAVVLVVGVSLTSLALILLLQKKRKEGQGSGQ